MVKPWRRSEGGTVGLRASDYIHPLFSIDQTSTDLSELIPFFRIIFELLLKDDKLWETIADQDYAKEMFASWEASLVP